MSHGEGWRRNNLEHRWMIRERESFKNAQGSLEGLYVDGMTEEDAHGLVGDDLDRFLDDAPLIAYVVLSYSTPIHWMTIDGDDYTIERPPSKTTAGHRNLCPGYAPTREPGWTRAPRDEDGYRRRIRKEAT